jgi:hypothetical protein
VVEKGTDFGRIYVQLFRSFCAQLRAMAPIKDDALANVFLSVASALKVPPGSSQFNVHVAPLACSGQNQPKFLRWVKTHVTIVASS